MASEEENLIEQLKLENTRLKETIISQRKGIEDVKKALPRFNQELSALREEKKNLLERIEQKEAEYNELRTYYLERADYCFQEGLAYEKERNIDHAIESHLKALAFNENESQSHYTLAHLYQKIRRWHMVIFHFEKYMELSPTASDVHKIEAYLLDLREALREAKLAGSVEEA